MASVSETGHAVNLGNFKELIAKAQGIGAKYVPSNPALKVANLQAQVAGAETLHEDVRTKKATLAVAINNRQYAFGGLKKKATRVVNSFQSVVTEEAAWADLATINRKIQSARKSKINPDNLTAKTISISQQSFDMQKDHWEKLIIFLQQYPLYAPNEVDLKIPALQAIVTQMEAAEAVYNPVGTAYQNALIARNAAFYANVTGLVATAKLVKKYVKSSATAEQFKVVNRIAFRTIKDR